MRVGRDLPSGCSSSSSPDSTLVVLSTALPAVVGCTLGGGSSVATAYPTLLWMCNSNAIAAAGLTPPTCALAAIGATGIVAAEKTAHLDVDSHLAVLLSLLASSLIASARVLVHRLAEPPHESCLAASDEPDPRKEALRLRKSWDARLSWRERRRRKTMLKTVVDSGREH